MDKKYYIIAGLILLMLMLSGCQKADTKEAVVNTGYRIYYVNRSATRVVSESYTAKTDEESGLLEELLEALKTEPFNPDWRAPISNQVTLLSAHLENGHLYLSFDSNYNTVTGITEILNRAAIVRTISQIETVEYISFYINEQPLLDSFGQPVGMMRASDFIDDLGGDINDYQRTTLNLYFANETGDKLKEVTREVVYGSSISMERLVLEQLIGGPSEDENAYPVLSAEIKLLSVLTREGICYVNLEENFLTSSVNTTEAVTIYAIVNSLVELPNINKVQISVNGETNKKYRELIPLDEFFERNLDLLAETEE